MSRFPLVAILTLGFFALQSGPGYARDTHHMFKLSDALGTAAAKEKLDPGIRLFFGKQKTPKVLEDFGTIRSSRKTNAFGKDDKTACEWVFLSVMLAFQEKAKAKGANALIEIKSNYQNNLKSSETEYECGAGAVIAGTAFEGRLVKLAP